MVSTNNNNNTTTTPTHNENLGSRVCPPAPVKKHRIAAPIRRRQPINQNHLLSVVRRLEMGN